MVADCGHRTMAISLPFGDTRQGDIAHGEAILQYDDTIFRYCDTILRYGDAIWRSAMRYGEVRSDMAIL
jgi:hypothetical protein